MAINEQKKANLVTAAAAVDSALVVLASAYNAYLASETALKQDAKAPNNTNGFKRHVAGRIDRWITSRMQNLNVAHICRAYRPGRPKADVTDVGDTAQNAVDKL